MFQSFLSNILAQPFFKYNVDQLNVLEVNKTDYETCIPDHPLHNWTGGAGRDVVPLDVTRNYYIISDEQSCSFGMRLAIHVDNLPPPSSKATLLL
ncbi:Blue copper protein precursor, putative [Fagus crenata]